MLYNDGVRYKTRFNRNVVYVCTYHVVWCTKYRRPILSPEIGARLEEIVRAVVQEVDGEVHEVAVMPDHVHVIVGCDPSFGIMRLVRLMKGRTSRLLRQEYRPLRTRVPTLWTNATFVATTGGAALDGIKKYVESQRGV
jgi:putative transposase